MNSALGSRLALGFCVLLALSFFADTLIGPRTVIPTGFLTQAEPWASALNTGSPDSAQQYDLVFQFYPWARYFKESVLAGRFPLWNPFTYLGTPFFANPQTAVLFPLTWIHLLLPLELSFGWIFMLKLGIALIGMFLFLRDQGLGPLAGLSGAVIFGLSMHTVVSLPFPYSNVSVLLPWLLLCSTRVFRSPGLLNWALTVTVSAALILAGQPQSCLAAFLATGIYTLTQIRKRDHGWIAGLRRALVPGTALLAAVPLTAIQWNTSLAYVAESMVPWGPRIIKSGFPYAPGSFLNLAVPDFFGSHLRGDYWGFPGYHDIAFYSSVLVLLLVPLAFTGPAEARWKTTLAPAITGTIAALLLLGLPPFESLLDLPGFDLIRRNKMVVLLVLALAHLAAVGVQRLIDGIRPRGGLLTSVAVASPVIVAASLWWFSPFLSQLDPDGHVLWNAARSGLLLLAGVGALAWLRGQRIGAALLALVLIDLYPMGYPLNPRGDARALYPETPITGQFTGRPPRIYGLDGVFPPNSAQVYGLQDVRGYDVMTPRRLFRFMQAIDPSLGNAYTWLMGVDQQQIGPNSRMRAVIEPWLNGDGSALAGYMKRDSYWSVTAEVIHAPALFGLLNVDYLVARTERVDSLPGFTRQAVAGPVSVLFNREAARAALFTDWRVSGQEDALPLLGKVDASRTVIVESATPPPAAAPQPAVPLEPATWDPQEAAFVTDRPAPSILVVFERFSPGWTAELEDGSRLEVFPADFIFRGVQVPPGRHRITFRYRPRSFHLGMLISASTLALLAALLPIFRLRCTSVENGSPAATGTPGAETGPSTGGAG